MGYANNGEEVRPSSADAEDSLPLYIDIEGDFPADAKAPDPTATPDEVRRFLVQVMQGRGIATDHARRVAARWMVGTGRELRSYPVTMYRDIFGPEDAWVVYKEVRTRHYKNEKEKHLFRNVGYAILFLLSLIVFGGSIAMMASTESEVVFAIGWLSMSIGLMLVGVNSIPVFFDGNQEPEMKAEQELQNEWCKSPSIQPGSNE